MIRFLLIFQIIYLATGVYCQETDQHNQIDSLDNKHGLEVSYDIEHLKYHEIKRVQGEIEYSHYFTRSGDTISVYNWRINIAVIDKIKDRILNDFNVNDLTHGMGSALLFLILDFEKNVYEIRVVRGIAKGFNDELLRVVEKVEKDLIFVCTSDCKTPIVTPFAFRVDRRNL